MHCNCERVPCKAAILYGVGPSWERAQRGSLRRGCPLPCLSSSCKASVRRMRAGLRFKGPGKDQGKRPGWNEAFGFERGGSRCARSPREKCLSLRWLPRVGSRGPWEFFRALPWPCWILERLCSLTLAAGRLPAPSSRFRSPRLHHTGLDVLADGLVVVVMVVVIRAAGRWVEGRDAVEIEDEILPVAHRAGVVLVPRQAHCGERKREKVSPRKALGTEWVGSRENGDSCPGVKWRDGNP